MSLTQKELISKLKSRFNELGVNFNNLRKILIKHNAFISGSFLLQILQNKNYKKSDIDIYVLGKRNVILEKNIHNLLIDSIVTKIKTQEPLKNIQTTDCDITQVVVFDKDNNKTKNDNIEDSDYDDIGDSDHEDINQAEKVEINELSKSVYKHKYTSKSDCSRYIEHKYIERWNKKMGDKSKDYYRLDFSPPYIRPVPFIKNYKNIEGVFKGEITNEYSHLLINAIINFECNNILEKYQLIYYDSDKYKSPLEVINEFDFDFCKSYFDGKVFYIKNIDSIKSSSCIFNIKNPRIYRNQNKRIIKYLLRGFDIKINYDGNLYDVAYLIEDGINITLNKKISNDTRFLIIINNLLSKGIITDILRNLPCFLEKLIIYGYNKQNIVDNLPICLNEFRLYNWRCVNGIENDIPDYNICKNIESYMNNKVKDKNMSIKMYMLAVYKNINHIPFNCKIFFNDVLFENTIELLTTSNTKLLTTINIEYHKIIHNDEF